MANGFANNIFFAHLHGAAMGLDSGL